MSAFIILIFYGTFYTIKMERNDTEKLSEKNRKIDRNSMLMSSDLDQKKNIDIFWSCFCLRNNLNFIFSQKLGKESLSPIHGIRVFALYHIVMGHFYFYAFATMDNPHTAFSYAEAWILQPIYTATMSVDTFFAISGLVLAYGFYEKQKRRPSKNLTIDVIKAIIYRYLRIAPCFLIVR
jgi:hypothetical protein